MATDLRTALPLPSFGAAGRCTSTTAGPGGEQPGFPVPVADGASSSWAACPPGVRPSYAGTPAGDLLDAFAGLLDGAHRQALQPMSSVEDGSPVPNARVRIASGAASLAVQVQLPAAGTLDPRPLFTYW